MGATTGDVITDFVHLTDDSDLMGIDADSATAPGLLGGQFVIALVFRLPPPILVATVNPSPPPCFRLDTRPARQRRHGPVTCRG